MLEEAVVSLQDEALSGPEESQKAEPDKRTPTKVRAMVPKKYPTRLGQKPGCFREANADEYIRKLQPLSQANTHWPNYFVPLSKVTLPRGLSQRPWMNQNKNDIKEGWRQHSPK